MGFRLEQNGWSYMAYASMEVEEDHGKLRSGIEFVAVERDSILPFLRRYTGHIEKPYNDGMTVALNAYLEHGADSSEFRLVKGGYFGDPKLVYYITVWFNDSSEAEQISLTDWYEIMPGAEYDFEIEEFLGPETVLKEKCFLKKVPAPDQEALNVIYTTQSEPIRDEEEPENLIAGATRFWRAYALYMGAALCVGLVTAEQIAVNAYGVDITEGFFDLGYASGSRSHNVAVQALSYTVENNLIFVLERLENTLDQVIFISHWHSDHTNIIRKLLNPPAVYNFTNFWATSRWFTPATANPVAGLVQAAIGPAHAAHFNVLPNSNPAVNVIHNALGNPRLRYGKVDLPNAPHPHHHGIYVRLTLVNANGTVRGDVLLSGDCTYSLIPAAGKNGVRFLQASHHGGNYALDTNVPANRTPHIPAPVAPHTVVYSADGHTYHHPKPTFVNEHTGAGWANQSNTYQAANGFVSMR